VTLDLVIVCRAEKVDERSEKASFNNGGFVGGVDGDVSYACNGRQDKWEVGRLQETEKRRQAACAHNLELVAFVGRKVSQGEGSLALHLGRRRLHEVDERPDKSALGLGEFRAVGCINGDVAERSGTVVLDVYVCGREQLNEDGDCAGVYELLAIVVWRRLA
jgi:hypothetical protein